jgi:hypothetical protein
MALERFARGSILILGRPVPNPVVAFGAAVLGFSVLGALAPGLRLLGLLIPERVWVGEIWRLVTWVLFEVDPISLVFAVFMIVMFGGDLYRVWGPGRFLISVLALAVIPGAVTSLIAAGLFNGRLMPVPYYSSWPVIEGLIIAWGLLYATRRLLFFFVVPMQGRTLVWLTIGMTFFFAIFQGFAAFIPHFVAEGLALLAFDRLNFVRRLWLRARLMAYERDLKRRAGSMHVVSRRDDDDRPRWVN